MISLLADRRDIAAGARAMAPGLAGIGCPGSPLSAPARRQARACRRGFTWSS
jgi:hypothetical protein